MDNLSPGAWICIGALALFFIVLNLSLLGAVRQKPPSPWKPSQAWGNTLLRVGKTMRKPWQSEDADLDELSQRVASLHKEDTSRPE